MAIAATNGQIFEEFDRIRIGNPLQDKAHQLFEDLRYARRRSAGSPQKWGGLFGPTQSGKTMSVTTYIETKVVDELILLGKFAADMDRKKVAKQQRTVVPVNISAEATPSSLAIDILQAFGEPAPSRGTTQGLLARVYECLRDQGTELLIIEEVQYLVHQLSWRNLTPATGTAVTNTLKSMLLKGVTPIVLIGNMESRWHLIKDSALAACCVKELNFGTQDNSDRVNKEIFSNFIGTLGLKLKLHGLFEEGSDFLSGDVIACIHEVTQGRIGMASNLVRAACIVAREAGAARVTREHLAIGTDAWAIPMGIVDYNPFEDGVRSTVCGRAPPPLGAVRHNRLPTAVRRAVRLEHRNSST